LDFRLPFILAFALAVVLAPIAATLGRKVGLVDKPGTVKIHDRPIPVSGGLAVAVSLSGAVALVGGIVDWTVVAACALALVVGIADDVTGLRPTVRIAVLGICGGLLAAGALPSPLHPIALAGAILLTLVTTNAVNLMDGQNGLASGLGIIASAGLALISMVGVTTGNVSVGLGMSGALLGFLVWNFPRAKLFLGNGGAYLVGAILSYQALVLAAEDGLRGLIVAGACVSLFALEFAVTIYRRVSSRIPLAAGDRFHSYDILSRRLGRAGTTIVFWAFGLGLASLAVLLSRMPLVAAVGGATAGGVACLITAFVVAREVRGKRMHVDNPPRDPFIKRSNFGS
jgi:UDP-GlcNAc:undecaprenyl-phosphate GlcNAc-1-phosphate transferase